MSVLRVVIILAWQSYGRCHEVGSPPTPTLSPYMYTFKIYPYLAPSAPPVFYRSPLLPLNHSHTVQFLLNVCVLCTICLCVFLVYLHCSILTLVRAHALASAVGAHRRRDGLPHRRSKGTAKGCRPHRYVVHSGVLCYSVHVMYLIGGLICNCWRLWTSLHCLRSHWREGGARCSHGCHRSPVEPGVLRTASVFSRLWTCFIPIPIQRTCLCLFDMMNVPSVRFHHLVIALLYKQSHRCTRTISRVYCVYFPRFAAVA